MNELIISLENETRELLNAVRGSSIKLGENLHKLKEVERDEKWGDYLRDTFDISEGFASKLVKIYKVFILEGGLSREAIEGIDGEKLYLAAGLEGSIEEKLSRAKVNSRSELRAEKEEKDGNDPEAFMSFKDSLNTILDYMQDFAEENPDCTEAYAYNYLRNCEYYVTVKKANHA
jgi:hypothetical protein